MWSRRKDNSADSRIKGRASPSPCTSTREIIRNLAIPLFRICILRIKERASPSPCTSTREIIRNLAISFFEIVILRIKGRGISVPMYLDEENYTQPCDFPSSEFSYCVQREGASPSPCTSMRKFIRSLAISPIGILILRIKVPIPPVS